VEAVFSAPAGLLAEVEGIGKKKAETIRKLLTTEVS
jgi:ERCC4-type nuclease